MAEDDGDGSGFSALLEKVLKGAQNALELAQVGRLSPEQHVPFTVERRERVYRLRRYPRNPAVAPLAAPVILVPPLMITSEVYDIDPESSAVTQLTDAGVDTWLVDFGSPEQEEGGLERTLDDHVLAVSRAIDHVRSEAGHDVHLVGYSQGGMFCYQAAAYRRSQGIASIVAFGSPVDIHRNMMMGNELAVRVVDTVRGLLKRPLSTIDAVPGEITAGGFRLMAARKELKRFFDFATHLHDREALMRGEASRRFLHGEGFVAWPGPALRSFVDQFVVHNRLTQGGFVIDGQTLTLADIRCPILCFVGERDDIARPGSVRAIKRAAPNARTYEVALRAGHFGLVVGTLATRTTWPTVIGWVRWREQKGQRPENLTAAGESKRPEALEDVVEARFEDVEYNVRLAYDTVRGTANTLKRRVNAASDTLAAMFDNLRYQMPRIARLERIEPTTRVNIGRSLAEQAAKNPDGTFFLFGGRAHSYIDANRRVDNVVKGLIQCGVRQHTRVGVIMHSRPTYLSLVAALSRLGAVGVLISPEQRRMSLDQALELGEVEILITDPERAALGRSAFKGPVLVLGGGNERRVATEGVIDMESIDPEAVVLPDWYEPNPGRARDLALVIFSAGKDERPRAARITNRRWAVAAYGAASASTLTPGDTVYCVMPLDHAAGLLVSVGGALVGGARIALTNGFDPEAFWDEVRRYGATVVYYAGDMCRALVDAPSSAADKSNPVRLFAGSGMRIDVWKRMIERFRVGVLELYATTEGNAALANVSGQRVGALGKPLPGTVDLALVQYDFAEKRIITSVEGRPIRCYPEQHGILLARIDAASALSTTENANDVSVSARVLRSAFEPNDAWFITGDILRIDADGVYWFVDRAADMVLTSGGPVSTIQVEDALYELPEIQQCAVMGHAGEGRHQVPVAVVVVRPGYVLDPATLAKHVSRRLDACARPRAILQVARIPLSVGFRPLKSELRASFDPAAEGTLRYEEASSTYVAVEAPVHEARAT